MDSAVLVAIVSGLCVAVPSVLATMASNSKSQALMDYKINELTKKVEEHNKLQNRMLAQELTTENLTKSIEELKEKIRKDD